MDVLYKYVCEKCDIPTYVEWHAVTESGFPYCSSCGSDQLMNLVAEVEVGEEREYED